jgi:hypothetical protein
MCSQPSCDKWARSPDAGWCPWLCRANAGARRTQKVLALAQARKVDVILVTELTPWGRSARCAARSLTCFKFRFVSSPQIDAAELSPGEFAYLVRHSVEQDKARVIVIDSLNGYMNAMPEEQFLTAHLHELLTYLGRQGVATFMVVAQQRDDRQQHAIAGRHQLFG